jgi:phosphopantetheine adenylyltransferase
MEEDIQRLERAIEYIEKLSFHPESGEPVPSPLLLCKIEELEKRIEKLENLFERVNNIEKIIVKLRDSYNRQVFLP